MDDGVRRYPERGPEFEFAGNFLAWIGPSGGGVSAVAFRLEQVDRQVAAVENVYPSAGRSNEKRAVLQGVLGCCEALVAGSKVEIRTHETYVKEAVESLREWASAGWRGKSGPVANSDILRLILQITQDRQLALTVTHIPKSKRSVDSGTIDRLTLAAHDSRPAMRETKRRPTPSFR